MWRKSSTTSASAYMRQRGRRPALDAGIPARVRGQNPRIGQQYARASGEREDQLRHFHLHQGADSDARQREIRRKAVERNIPCLTSIDTANAIVDSLKSRYSEVSTELVDINHLRSEKMKLKFTKMQGCGNDYIYFNVFDQVIDNPEGLSERLSTGISVSAATALC